MIGAHEMYSVVKDALPENFRLRLSDFTGRGVYAKYADEYKCIFIHIPKTGGVSVVS